MQVKKKQAERPKSLLTQTSCFFYGTRRGREIQQLIVPYWKAFFLAIPKISYPTTSLGLE